MNIDASVGDVNQNWSRKNCILDLILLCGCKDSAEIYTNLMHYEELHCSRPKHRC